MSCWIIRKCPFIFYYFYELGFAFISIREDSDQTTSPLGGAAAAKLEQLRLKDSGKSNNYPDLLELEGEFGWSDRVPQRIYEKVMQILCITTF